MNDSQHTHSIEVVVEVEKYSMLCTEKMSPRKWPLYHRCLHSVILLEGNIAAFPKAIKLYKDKTVNICHKSFHKF